MHKDYMTSKITKKQQMGGALSSRCAHKRTWLQELQHKPNIMAHFDGGQGHDETCRYS